MVLGMHRLFSQYNIRFFLHKNRGASFEDTVPSKRKHTFRRISLLLIVGVLLLSSLVSLIRPTNTASAASSTCQINASLTNSSSALCATTIASSFTPDQEATSYSYYIALGGCMAGGAMPSSFNTKPSEDGNSPTSEWFSSGTFNGLSVQATVFPNATLENCSSIATSALALWGWTGSTETFLKALGYTYNLNSGQPTYTNSLSGADLRDKFHEIVADQVYGGVEPTLSAAAEYDLDSNAFLLNGGSCQANDLGIYPSLGGNSTLSTYVKDKTNQDAATSTNTGFGITSGTLSYRQVNIVDSTAGVGTISDHGYAYISSTTYAGLGAGSDLTPDDNTQNLYGYQGEADQDASLAVMSKGCSDLISTMNSDAVAYASWIQKHPTTSMSTEELCATTPSAAGCPPVVTTNSCAINGVGWIICPVITVLGQLSDGMFQFLADNFLQTNVSTLATSGPTDGTYTAWGIMRNIANAAFVVVFLIIIFSQISNFGVNNYGIKKMLPRLIVAAILVNLSFFVCQIAVDLSNILGFGLKGIFDNIGANVYTLSKSVPTGADGTTGANGWESIVVIVLAAGGGYAAYAALGTLIPLLIGALITILVIFLMLILRQMLIILLIVVAPLAFVAYLLPNTESLFKRWRQVLTSLLILYPIIGLVFGASSLASTILSQAYQGTAAGTSTAGTGGNVIEQIIAQAVLVIPLIIVPSLLKASLNGVGQLGAKINGFGNNVSNAGKKKTAEAYGESRLGQFQNYRKNVKANRRGMIRAGTYEGSNPFRKLNSAINSGLNNASGKFGTRLEASGVAAATKQQAEEVALAEKLVNAGVTKNGSGHAKVALESALKSGDRVAAQAAQNILFTQGAAGMKDFYDTVNNGQEQGWANDNAVSALRENINANHGLMVKTKASDASKWASKGGKLSEYTKAANTWAGQSQTELSDQTGDSLMRAAGLESDGKGGTRVVGPNLLDGTVAGQLLNNDQLKGKLNETQIRALQHASGTSGGSGGAPPSGGGGTPPPPGFDQQSNGLVIPRSRK
jgi:hypothetical protein